jgi:hypothetical protein
MRRRPSAQLSSVCLEVDHFAAAFCAAHCHGISWPFRAIKDDREIVQIESRKKGSRDRGLMMQAH